MSQEPEKNIPWLELEQFLQEQERGWTSPEEEFGGHFREGAFSQRTFAFKCLNFLLNLLLKILLCISNLIVLFFFYFFIN